MSGCLDGKTAIVTGASRGIGKAIREAFEREGARVVWSNDAGERIDVRSPAQVYQALLENEPSILVNNAGVYDASPDTIFDINVTCLEGFIRGFAKVCPPNSRIINIASVAGIRGGTQNMAYAASKASVINITKSYAMLLADRGITVNVIAPGYIDTDMLKQVDVDLSMVPLGRVGRPEEVAHWAVALAADDAGYTTGATIDVNGGMNMR